MLRTIILNFLQELSIEIRIYYTDFFNTNNHRKKGQILLLWVGYFNHNKKGENKKKRVEKNIHINVTIEISFQE